jgi:hypothetical protein
MFLSFPSQRTINGKVYYFYRAQVMFKTLVEPKLNVRLSEATYNYTLGEDTGKVFGEAYYKIGKVVSATETDVKYAFRRKGKK